MKTTHSTRQHWQLAPAENEGPMEYQKTRDELFDLLAEHASMPDFLKHAKVLAEDYLHAQSLNSDQLIRNFKAQLQEHTGQENIAAYLTAGLVLVLAESDVATLMPRLLGFKYHSVELEWFWVDGLIFAAQNKAEFKADLIAYAKQQAENIDHQLLAGFPEQAQLNLIWYSHYDRHYDVGFSLEWRWFDLLWQMDQPTFLSVITGCKSHYTVSHVFIRSGVDDSFNLWQQVLGAAPRAFADNGEWNRSYLLPMMLAEASQGLLQSVRDLKGYQQQTIDLSAEPEIRALITDIASTVAQREDFIGLIKPWACCLFKKMNDYSKSMSVSDQLDQALLECLLQQLPNLQVLSDVVDSEHLDAWLYTSLLGWLVHKFPGVNIELPDPENFIKQWQFSHSVENSWFSAKGERLVKNSREFTAHESTSPLTECLGRALALAQAESTAQYWQKMWQGSYRLREALKFNTNAPKGCTLSSYEAIKLNCLLLELGLAMLTQLELSFTQGHLQLKSVINELFMRVWQASFTPLQPDYFKSKNIRLLQEQLLLMRKSWQQMAEQGNEQYIALNNTLELTHIDLLKAYPQ